MSTDQDVVVAQANSTPAEYDEMTFTGVLEYAKTLFGLPEQVRALVESVQILERQVAEQVASVNALRQELADARDTIRERNDEIVALNQEVTRYTQAHDELQAEIRAVRSERDNAEATVSTLRNVIIDRDDVVAQLKRDVASATDALHEANSIVATRDADVGYWKARHNQEETARHSLAVDLLNRDQEVAALLARLVEADDRQRQLEGAIADAHSHLKRFVTVVTGEEFTATLPQVSAPSDQTSVGPAALATDHDGQVDIAPDTGFRPL